MRIAVVNTFSPFVHGGAEFVVSDLIDKLNKLPNIEASHFTIPFPEHFDTNLIKFTLSSMSLNFDDYDMLIAFKYPAYCIPHRNKVIWIFHQLRQVYDLWDTQFGFKQNESPHVFLKEFVTNIDNKYIPNSTKIFTLSKEVAERLNGFNGINSEVMYSPLKDDNRYYCDSFEDYVIYPSRISPIKRQHLAIEAMKYTKTNVKLMIVGKCSESSYEKTIEDLINSNNLTNKVILTGEITQNDKFKLFSKCLGAVFIPFKEDYGLVTLEASLSKKPTICTFDSGGIREFITDHHNGLITDPDPKKLAESFDYLYANKDKAQDLGKKAYEQVKELNLNWETIINRILK